MERKVEHTVDGELREERQYYHRICAVTKLGSQSAGRAPDLTEFDLGYHGWPVVLAACLGVMVGFGSLFVYSFAVLVTPLNAEFG
jgi:hypothetical protein